MQGTIWNCALKALEMRSLLFFYPFLKPNPQGFPLELE